MGTKLPVFPRHREPWGSCSVCGFDVPRSELRLHKRFGWSCKSCWDGGPHADEMFYIPRPYEGSRRTAAPLTNTLTEGDLTGGLPYHFLDQTTGAHWIVTFGYDGEIRVAPGGSGAFRAWRLSPYPQWRWFIADSVITTNTLPVGGEVPTPGDINLTVSAGGEWSYTP